MITALLLFLAPAVPASVESIDASAWPAPAPLVERRVGPHLSGLLRAARLRGSSAVAIEAARRGIDRDAAGRFVVEVERTEGGVRRRTVTLDVVPLLIADPEVRAVRLPSPAVPTRLTQGVALTSADVAHVAGATGDGCRLAVIDAGFKGLSALIGAGTVPAPTATKNYTSSGLEKSSSHGSAVTEIAHQMAPDAKLFLVKISNLTDFEDALQWVASKNVDVVNISLGFQGINFSDGSGRAAKAVKKARKKGVLPVVSAGNNGDGHWLGAWNDPDQDKFLDFAVGDEGLTIAANAGASVAVHLVWDDFPKTEIDLDLAVYYVGTLANPIPPGPDTLQGFSTVIQNGSQPPYEVVSFGAPLTGRYAIFVNRVKKKPTQVALFTSQDVVDGNNVPGSSLLTPGDAVASLTVGALRATQWTTGPVEEFSARGPNLKGAPKPQLVGPDGTTSAVASLNPFFGTSAAAPHVAGAACVVKSANGVLGPDGLEERLISGALPVPGATVDEAGAGRLDLGFDFMPPTPNPAVVDPASGATADSATVVATAAADVTPPIEYRFEYLGKAKHGGDSRGWATSATYVDGDLKPDRVYKYEVRARDAAAVPNLTSWSETAKLRTHARIPGAPAASAIKSTSVKLLLDPADNPSTVEYAIFNQTDGVWLNKKGKPSPTEVWRSADAWGSPKAKGLSPATTYTMRVKARNSDDVETALSDPLMVTTGG